MLLISWFLADLLTGLVHWFEDKCLNEQSKFKFIQSITEDNIRHHKDPTALCNLSFWGNIDTSAIIAWPLSLILYLIGCNQIIYMAVFFASFANIIHMYTHQKKDKIPLIIKALQKTGIVCSQNHHIGHHYLRGRLVNKKDAKIRYCVMTNYLNPILDEISIFPFLEKLIGIKD